MRFPDLPIETERLVLRPWEDDDVDALADAVTASIDHLRPWMAWISFEPMSRDDRGSLIADWRAARLRGDDLVLGIFHDGTPVGGTGLHDRLGPGGLEVGYWIHVDHVRKGFASEAVAALADAALALADIEVVHICHDATNHASAGVPARVGFARRGDRSAPVKAPAETGTQWVWELRRPA
ncbi:MAG: GNAT family N-acetyltransferase [Acidimicrobiales bacterium]